MSKNKWERRERKWRKRRHGMQVDGRSVFVVVEIKVKKSKKRRKK